MPDSETAVLKKSQKLIIKYLRGMHVVFLTRGMITLDFHLVLKKAFVLPACKFDEQKRPSEIFGH